MVSAVKYLVLKVAYTFSMQTDSKTSQSSLSVTCLLTAKYAFQTEMTAFLMFKTLAGKESKVDLDEM